MTHIATRYIHEDSIIRYYWDQPTLSLYSQTERIKQDGSTVQEDMVQMDPDTSIWNEEEALEAIFGTSQPGIYDMEDGTTVVVYADSSVWKF